ncbi:MAG: hypothetical protein FJ386_14830 [Verrucomicrobia bacterium]|nr:hypothetical protein [Verrucomicrobiota bacterium]
MAKVKLSLDQLNALELIQLTDLIISRMTGNANFPTPAPTLASVQTQRDAVNTKNNLVIATRTLAEQQTGEVNTAASALRASLTALGSYVEGTSLGDEVKIRSSGMVVP